MLAGSSRDFFHATSISFMLWLISIHIAREHIKVCICCAGPVINHKVYIVVVGCDHTPGLGSPRWAQAPRSSRFRVGLFPYSTLNASVGMR